MQSQKKHKRPKREVMPAHVFAMTWAHNIGSFSKAVAMSDTYALKCRTNATREELTGEEKRESLRTANYFDNVGGILRKAQVKMGVTPAPKASFNPTPKKETKSVKKDTADRRPAAT